MAETLNQKYSLRVVEPDASWDHVVRQDGGQIFATSQFLHLLQAYFPHATPMHYAAYQDNVCVAVLPSFTVCVPSLGCVSNSSPFYGSHGGVYTTLQGSEREACVRDLLTHYQERCHTAGCRVSNVVEPLGNKEAALYGEVLAPWKTEPRIGQIVENLVADDEAMMARYHYKTRNMVRKAQKENITIRTSTQREALDFLHQIHVENMLGIGGRAKPKHFFDLIPQYFEPNTDWLLYEASLGDERIASLLVLFFGDCVEYFTPVICQEFRHLQPMSLLVHTALVDAARRGFSRFNFGGTWKTQEGVYRFKNRWGATDIPYQYYINRYCEDATFFNTSPQDLLTQFNGFYLFPLS